MPAQSVEGEELVELPAGVHFVTKEWVADCLAQGKLLPEGRYLTDLAQMALLAKLQVPRTAPAFPVAAASSKIAERSSCIRRSPTCSDPSRLSANTGCLLKAASEVSVAAPR